MTLDIGSDCNAHHSRTLAGNDESVVTSRSMRRAALYARVSSDAQQKEGTIESQVAELKRQIDDAGHALVKQYIDDGIPGPLLDRPALNQLREDAKKDVYDVVYFLDADRIARLAAYQTIIIEELLKNKKQIIIKGQNYEANPQNKMTLQMLGVISEYEHAKIIERMTRGRLHRLRQGQLVSSGHRIYGYDYVRKTATSPCKLVLNEEQAAIVRMVFEMFASGQYGLVTICRHLEERGILTLKGKKLWDNDRIKTMLMTETYAGTRNYNRVTREETLQKGKLGKVVYRDQSEWIPVSVPAIISRELFDRVQEMLAKHNERYCRPQTHYLLSGLVQCGCCGSRGSSSRSWHRVRRPSGKVSVYHQAHYRCIRKAEQNQHHREAVEDRCQNSRVATHILEGKVFDLIQETLLDPAKLRGCIEGGAGLDDRGIARGLARVAEQLGKIEEERRKIINHYAAEELSGPDYIAANRALDDRQERLTRKKGELVAALRSPLQEDFIDASLRQFCAAAKAKWQASLDYDAKRQFLMSYIERVIYKRYHVAIVGTVPVQSASGETRLRFRIEGEIDPVKVRGNAARKAKENYGQFSLRPSGLVSENVG
jgi:site-specific DNA recombinase